MAELIYGNWSQLVTIKIIPGNFPFVVPGKRHGNE